MSRLLLSCAVAGLFGVTSAWAHHTMPGRTHPTVTLTQTVMADGKPLAPGTYEVWITDERPDVGAGAPSDAQRVVEFAQNNQVVARDGRRGASRVEAGKLLGRPATRVAGRASRSCKDGEFVRVSINDAAGRFLIHLPTGPLNEPAPQPQSPSRIVLPPQGQSPQ